MFLLNTVNNIYSHKTSLKLTNRCLTGSWSDNYSPVLNNSTASMSIMSLLRCSYCNHDNTSKVTRGSLTSFSCLRPLLSASESRCFCSSISSKRCLTCRYELASELDSSTSSSGGYGCKHPQEHHCLGHIRNFHPVWCNCFYTATERIIKLYLIKKDEVVNTVRKCCTYPKESPAGVMPEK